MERITVKIDGMTCGHCVGSVTKALESLHGVNVERVGIGEASVAYDPAATSADQIRQAVEDEGYSVVPSGR